MFIKNFAKEFKEFAMRGNVMDLAVGVIMGAAFGKVVSSLVNDIIMPIIGVLAAGVDFSKLGITLKSASDPAQSVIFKYGAFIQTILDFILVSFAVFMMIKFINALKRKEAAAPAASVPSNEEQLLTEIRDLLKK